jgi:hypothetical protein
MDTLEIQQMLDALDELQAQRTVLAAPLQEKITTLTAERDHLTMDLDESITTLTADIKAAVLDLGNSVKATHLHAVWSKPRVSWDTKSLDGYAVAHPELFAFRKEGKPSVSIRACR